MQEQVLFLKTGEEMAFSAVQLNDIFMVSFHESEGDFYQANPIKWQYFPPDDSTEENIGKEIAQAVLQGINGRSEEKESGVCSSNGDHESSRSFGSLSTVFVDWGGVADNFLGGFSIDQTTEEITDKFLPDPPTINHENAYIFSYVPAKESCISYIDKMARTAYSSGFKGIIILTSKFGSKGKASILNESCKGIPDDISISYFEDTAQILDDLSDLDGDNKIQKNWVRPDKESPYHNKIPVNLNTGKVKEYSICQFKTALGVYFRLGSRILNPEQIEEARNNKYPQMDDWSNGCVVIYCPDSESSEEEMQCLMIKPAQKPYWSFPKGHPDENETNLDAAIRETFEETGLQLDKTNVNENDHRHISYTFVGNLHNDKWKEHKDYPNEALRPKLVIHKIVRYYRAIITGKGAMDRISKSTNETDEIQFFPISDNTKEKYLSFKEEKWVFDELAMSMLEDKDLEPPEKKPKK